MQAFMSLSLARHRPIVLVLPNNPEKKKDGNPTPRPKHPYSTFPAYSLSFLI